MLSEAQFNTWIEALESEKYIQGKGCLRNGSNKFCCLGVLADTMGANWDYDLQEDAYEAIIMAQRKLSFVPFNILDCAIQVPLSEMNDSGKSFEEIIQYLKENKDAYVNPV